MNKYKINILSYIKTIFLSVFLGGILTGLIVFYAQNDVVNHSVAQNNDKRLKQYIKDIVITQNQTLEYEHPDDYRIDIHLGYLHNVIQEYDKAEEYYLKAVKKAPMGVYKPLYELTSFYIEQKRYEEAYDELEKFPHNNNTAVLKFLSKLYEKFGDVYYSEGLYYYSVKDLQSAINYRGKLKNSSQHISRLNKKLYTSAVALADLCLNNDKQEEAVKFLEIACKANPNDFNAQYKYAIASVNVDSEKSYETFRKLYKKEPSKINYRMYHALLEKMSYEYEEQGDYVKSKLFKFRANDLLANVAENILYPEDIKFELTKKSLYRRNNKCKILMQCDIYNLSNVPIKVLQMNVIYKLDDKIIDEYNKDLILSGCSILPEDSLTEIGIVPKNSRKLKKEDIPKINVEIYMYKKDISKQVCVYKGYLFNKKEHVEETHSNHLTVDYGSYIKFFANQLLNIEETLKIFINSFK